MAGKVKILNIKIDKVSMGQTITKIKKILKDKDRYGFMIVTPNPEIVIRAQTDVELARILNSANLAIPDGGGIVLASYLLKDPLPERVAGFDLMQELFLLADSRGDSIFLLGGKPGILKQVKENLHKQYKNIDICGIHHGYLDQKEQKQVVEEINQKKPDLLFVGMGVPLQEKFLDKYINKMKVKVAMTVGGSFDVLAGEVKRAPLWMQKLYLEWFYRLIKEPERFGRMLALPKFVFRVIVETLRKAGERDE
ncbi:MAG: WecB/TagA/CpsF family glycosyltransferase [Bacillota bacterium]